MLGHELSPKIAFPAILAALWVAGLSFSYHIFAHRTHGSAPFPSRFEACSAPTRMYITAVASIWVLFLLVATALVTVKLYNGSLG
jgi:hypothetical protein